MLLWIILAALTAGVLAVLLRPLMRPGADEARAGGGAEGAAVAGEIAVYKDQLAEIDADVARGLIGADEAENARREVGRRILAHEQIGKDVAPGASIVGRQAGLIVAGMVPVLAIGTYLALGAPGLPGRPHGSAPIAVPLDKTPIDDLIAKVEARLKANPGDGQGWDVLAPVYFRMQRYEDAATAYGNAARLLGDTAQRLAGFAEATVMASGGDVTDAAQAVYEKLAAMQPDRVEPKFWLALAKEQRGKTDEALAAYKSLLASAPADAPYRTLVEERIAGIGKPAGGASTPSGVTPPKGPSADDVKVAEGMSDKDRAQMIAGMVEGLAKRLQVNPQDARGWQQLVHSYAVLGESAKAKQALADAQRHLAGNAEATNELAALGKRLGL